jgi:RimJ/RimL family protein N-acetyltransferase
MVTLRPAAADDEARLLAWRNDPIVRASAFNQNRVSVETHRLWFARKLSDPACAILIAEEDGQPVGEVRLDRVETDLAEVHIAVAPEARGRGIGGEILSLAARDAQRLLGVTCLRALVKRSNEASLRTFRSAGFLDAGDDADTVEFLRSATY